MGKPRMIILVRHAQSEGNKNRDIHQFIPDHRVKLTSDGWKQAEDAGIRLRSLLKPDDTLHFFTSPYRRTRETTEGILRSLTSDDPTPSPFPRHKIKVFEEPRLREQDFGNFQPCSAEMERMWQERADYGHFFYRIPNGESAADAYDRISGFNESLWRLFGQEDFPSVCVLVTHGMMTRVFLMKWYHWSVEYFEDLRNINHCEFITMKQNPTNGKFILENELRTWSDMKRRAAIQNGTTTSATASARAAAGATNHNSSPTIPVRRWGGCANGCNHGELKWPRKAIRKNTAEFLSHTPLPPAAKPLEGEQEDHPIASQEADHTPTIKEPTPNAKLSRKPSTKAPQHQTIPPTPASPNDASNDESSKDDEYEGAGSSEADDSSTKASRGAPRTAAIMRHLHPPSKGPSKKSEVFSDDSDYFPGMNHTHPHHHSHMPNLASTAKTNSPSKSTNGNGKLRHRPSSKHRQESKERKLSRKMTEKEWITESKMGIGARADALGDGNESSDDEAKETTSPAAVENEGGEKILKEALKGDMIAEKSEHDREKHDEVKGLQPHDVEKLKENERKGFEEIY